MANELTRLESVVVAQSNQISTFWDFCNRMKEYLDNNDPKAANAVRGFMQKSNLFSKNKTNGWGKIATEQDNVE